MVSLPWFLLVSGIALTWFAKARVIERGIHTCLQGTSTYGEQTFSLGCSPNVGGEVLAKAKAEVDRDKAAAFELFYLVGIVPPVLVLGLGRFFIWLFELFRGKTRLLS